MSTMDTYQTTHRYTRKRVPDPSLLERVRNLTERYDTLNSLAWIDFQENMEFIRQLRPVLGEMIKHLETE